MEKTKHIKNDEVRMMIKKNKQKKGKMAKFKKWDEPTSKKERR